MNLKNRSSEKNALCRWIRNLRSFLNREFTVMYISGKEKSKCCFFTFNWLYFLSTDIDWNYGQDSPEFTWSNFMCFHILWTILYLNSYCNVCWRRRHRHRLIAAIPDDLQFSTWPRPWYIPTYFSKIDPSSSQLASQSEDT